MTFEQVVEEMEKSKRWGTNRQPELGVMALAIAQCQSVVGVSVPIADILQIELAPLGTEKKTQLPEIFRLMKLVQTAHADVLVSPEGDVDQRYIRFWWD